MSGHFEDGNIPDISETEERKRVNALRNSDNEYEDSVRDLAEKERIHRVALTKWGVGEEGRNELADHDSDLELKLLEAKKAGWTDDLTGLNNRKALDEEVPEIISISMESIPERPCAFLMLDFDKFKMVNDKFGHMVGDEALKKIADVITNETRSPGIVYRFGGEEFLIFLPNTSSYVAAEVAERIRRRVEETPFDLGVTDDKGNKVLLQQTVSIGYIGTDQAKEWKILPKRLSKGAAKEFMEVMIEHADKAMYAAKGTEEEGRNRVRVYTPDLEKREGMEKK